MQDPDIGSTDMAESGFHTGVFEPVRFSGIWRRQATEAREDLPLRIYDTNWKSAEEDPDTVFRLIQEDIDANFVQEFHGDIAQAKKAVAKEGGRWPPQRRQVGPARPAPVLGQHDAERQSESSD